MRLASILPLCACLALSFAPAPAQPPGGPPLIPLEDLARTPALRSPAISPDGSTLAMIEVEDSRGVVVVRPVGGASRRLYRNGERSIDNVAWSADGQWLLVFQDAGGDEGFHLFRIDPETGAARDLTPFAGSTAELVARPTGAPGSAIVTLNRRDPEWADVFRIDLADGALTEIVRNDQGFTEFHADERGRIVLATAIRPGGLLEVLTPGAESSPWRTVYRAPPAERFKVLAVQPGGRGAIVRSNRGAPAERLARLDLASGQAQALGGRGCGRFDDGEVTLDRGGTVAFLACVREREGIEARTPVARRALRTVRTLAGRESALALVDHAPDLSALLFHVDASDRSGRYLLFSGGRARWIGETRPWLAGRRFASSTHHWVPARDGLPVSIYVTRSLRSDGAQPTVVNIHGGPWSRDIGGFEPETQLLADRGYTVVQVNYRGSTGLGARHFEGGVRQFGRAMSDDIIDALDWAVARGMVDRGRTCVMGGSYGGYATLVGLTRDPDRFRCGVDFAGPADLITLIEAFPPSWRAFLPRSWYRFVGDPTNPADRAEMALHSPLRRAAEIRAPLLIFQGANDPRVTQAQSDSIVCALRGRGVEADYLLAGNEGHSFGNEETGLAVNRAVELFLARHLGGLAQSAVSDRTQSALDALRGAGAATRCAASRP